MNNRLVNCIFKEDIDVHGFKIKARTKGVIVSPRCPSVDCCIGVDVYVSMWDITQTPFSDYTFNKIINPSNKQYGLDGIVISTETKNIAIDISSNTYYYEQELYDWQVKRILDLDYIPTSIRKGEYRNKYRISDVVDYMNETLSDWVSEHGIFEKVTEKMIEDGDVSSEFEVGDNYLSNVEEFSEQELKLQKKLENEGYTYKFDGGLRWLD